MTTITLKKYLEQKTQAEVAAEIGVTQGAIWQMLRDQRQIELTIHEDGSVEAKEVKPVGRRSSAYAA